KVLSANLHDAGHRAVVVRPGTRCGAGDQHSLSFLRRVSASMQPERTVGHNLQTVMRVEEGWELAASEGLQQLAFYVNSCPVAFIFRGIGRHTRPVVLLYQLTHRPSEFRDSFAHAC